jgi:3'-5' exoribonuclease
MTRARPALVRLHELVSGQGGDFFALLAQRSRGATRDGKPYYLCRFRDSRRCAACMIWADSPWFETCEKNWKEGQCFKIRGVYQEDRQYGPQIHLHNIRPAADADRADGFSPQELAEASRFDPDTMLAELRGLVERHIADLPLRMLVLSLLDRHVEALKRVPGSQRHYYPFAGGLLEHTLSVTRSCLFLVDKYASHYPDLRPPLNRDLVVAGAVLHDLGRVLELESGPLAAQMTVPGRLLGHLFLGRDLVRDAAAELGNVDPELLQLLEHLIISHLNLPEWGSPRLPLIPESLILHHADDLDAKMEMYARCLTRDGEDGPFTARDPVLGRRLYKGRKL